MLLMYIQNVKKTTLIGVIAADSIAIDIDSSSSPTSCFKVTKVTQTNAIHTSEARLIFVCLAATLPLRRGG